MNVLRILSTLLALALMAGACQSSPRAKADDVPLESPGAAAPVAPIIAHRQEVHGLSLTDNYYWLRERDNPQVRAYLEAENAYTDQIMAPTRPLQEKIYQEMVGRIEETDLSVPYRHGNFVYYERMEAGKSYGIRCRKPVDPATGAEGPEQILLDLNALAQGKDYMALGSFSVSDDHTWLAYALDTAGNERYRLHLKNLATGEVLAASFSDTDTVAWAADGQHIFYTVVDNANRPYKVMRHRLGSAPSEDGVVYHEQDEAFHAYVSRSRSQEYLLLNLWSIATTEVRYLDADKPQDGFTPVMARKVGVEYKVDHHEQGFYVLTNQGAPNFRMMLAPVGSPVESWREVIAARADVTLQDVYAFERYLVLSERAGGLTRLVVWPTSAASNKPSPVAHTLALPESVYDVWLDQNPVYNSPTLRLQYTSLVTPKSVFDYHVDTQKLELRKESVVHHYDRTKYETVRLMATAADGTAVPISIVHRKGLTLDGSHALLLAGYGSYGISYDTYFSPARLSLLERGVIFAIAHPRGGGEMGRGWYEDGKLERKMNTFTDFIACAEYLVAKGYTRPERLAIRGGSAGGLLMGAVANLRPDLFRAVVADVPFVDVINTMLDASIPLTVVEYTEWGNPQDKRFFDIIGEYSPYDNVAPRAYPHMLVTAGLNDPRVQYWEPAKWVARLRATKTGEQTLLLRTNMGAGHAGASGRYEQFREEAFTYSFVLGHLGVQEP